MLSLRALREQQYIYTKNFVDYTDWRSPYTCFKMRLIMELCAVCVYFLQRTKIKPNTITVAYALLGVFGGVLLFINPVLGVACFVFKILLDAIDGQLARVTNQTSEIGETLDYFAGKISTIAFYLAILLGHTYLLPVLIILYFLGKLDGRGRTVDLLCLLILLRIFL